MTDARTEQQLRDWMQSSLAPEPDPHQSALAILARIDTPPPPHQARPRWLGGSFRQYLQVAAAVSVAIVFAGLLMALLGRAEPAPDEPVPAVVSASQSPEPAYDESPVHWRSDEVDLRADRMILRIGDEVYTGAGAPVDIEAEGADAGWWSLSPSWNERGERLDLTLDFRSDGSEWWVDSVEIHRPFVYGPLGIKHRGSIWLTTAGERVPLETAYVGDAVWTGETVMPTCDEPFTAPLEASLELDGLRLEVSPRERSRVEEVADRILGSAPVAQFLGEPAPQPSPRVIDLECAPGETRSLVLGNMTLEVEPAGEGVLRILGDDAGNELDQTIEDVAVGSDGAVVVAAATSLFGLGSTAPAIEASGQVERINRVDLAPDGSWLIRGGERMNRMDAASWLVDDAWVALPPYALPGPQGSGPRDMHDPVWDADGSLWVAVAGGVGRLDGDVWAHTPRNEMAPIASVPYERSFGPTRSLASTPSGELWVGYAHTLSELAGAGWLEHDPLEPFLDVDGSATSIDLGIGPEGTLWALIESGRRGSVPWQYFLVRRQAETWTVFGLDEVLPDMGLGSRHILVDDEGAVILLLGAHAAADRPGDRIVRFDGTTTTELGQLPAGLGYRLADIGPDGTVWLIGGSAAGRYADRIHILPGGESNADR